MAADQSDIYIAPTESGHASLQGWSRISSEVLHSMEGVATGRQSHAQHFTVFCEIAIGRAYKDIYWSTLVSWSLIVCTRRGFRSDDSVETDAIKRAERESSPARAVCASGAAGS